jgi:hypothetical protein
MAPLSLAGGVVGVGDLLKMAQHPAQPRRIQPPRRLQQHRLGLSRDLGGKLVGAVAQHASMGDRDLTVGQGGGGGRQRTRNKARAVRTKPAAAPAPKWSRLRSQAAVEPTWTPWSAPAAPRASMAASR